MFNKVKLKKYLIGMFAAIILDVYKRQVFLRYLCRQGRSGCVDGEPQMPNRGQCGDQTGQTGHFGYKRV